MERIRARAFQGNPNGPLQPALFPPHHRGDALGGALVGIGDVRVAQGDLPGGLAAFDEGLTIARDLAARDPGNAGWARDVRISVWRTAQVDLSEAARHWEEEVARMEDMDARGILLPTDAPYLEAARANLASARAARD
jgi:hypothetical protein